MKHKSKVLNILTSLGLIFLIALSITLFKEANRTGEKVENIVQVPTDFKREFSNVVTKRRLEPVVDVRFLSPEIDKVSWQDFKGDYLLVNFWATWCAPCVTELPSLEKLAQKFDGKGLEVIAISLDTMRNQTQIKTFLANRNIGDFAAYFDDESLIQRNIKMRGIPTSLLLDKDGNILYVFEGDAQWNSPSAVSFFENLLNS